MKICPKLCHFIWDIWWFHRSKDFEAMKAGKLAIRPWLACQYNENTLVDLPYSVGKADLLAFKIFFIIQYVIWENFDYFMDCVECMFFLFLFQKLQYVSLLWIGFQRFFQKFLQKLYISLRWNQVKPQNYNQEGFKL